MSDKPISEEELRWMEGQVGGTVLPTAAAEIRALRLSLSGKTFCEPEDYAKLREENERLSAALKRAIALRANASAGCFRGHPHEKNAACDGVRGVYDYIYRPALATQPAEPAKMESTLPVRTCGGCGSSGHPNGAGPDCEPAVLDDKLMKRDVLAAWSAGDAPPRTVPAEPAGCRCVVHGDDCCLTRPSCEPAGGEEAEDCFCSDPTCTNPHPRDDPEYVEPRPAAEGPGPKYSWFDKSEQPSASASEQMEWQATGERREKIEADWAALRRRDPAALNASAPLPALVKEQTCGGDGLISNNGYGSDKRCPGCPDCRGARAFPPTAPPPAAVDRCEVCEWPLAESLSEGCVPGNCSMRPVPRCVHGTTPPRACVHCSRVPPPAAGEERLRAMTWRERDTFAVTTIRAQAAEIERLREMHSARVKDVVQFKIERDTARAELAERTAQRDAADRQLSSSENQRRALQHQLAEKTAECERLTAAANMGCVAFEELSAACLVLDEIAPVDGPVPISVRISRLQPTPAAPASADGDIDGERWRWVRDRCALACQDHGRLVWENLEGGSTTIFERNCRDSWATAIDAARAKAPSHD